MESASLCPKCKNPLPAHAPKGLCPRCLFGRLIDDSSHAEIHDPSSHLPNSDDGGGGMPAGSLQSKKFGDYELVEEIARGGMGVVYRARQVSLNRTVALKMILAGLLASEHEVRRFKTESESAATLVHPNIIPLYEVGETVGLHYFTMKLVEGGSLAARLPELINSPGTAAKLLADIAHAVHYAHQHGILHRDLKPANILFDSHEIPHVTDFGLAKCVENPDHALTRTGTVIGTPAYMSPEQASGDSSRLTTASDVYSLGVMLYEMLTGRVPFTGDTTLAIIEKVRREDPVPPRMRNRKVDRDLEIICLKCLRKEPEKRYGSAEALANDLERWLSGKPILARPATKRERFMKWVKRHPVEATVTAMSILLICSVTGLYTRNQMALQRTETQKKLEKEKFAKEIAENGDAALKRALASKNARNPADFELHLIEAEEYYREALFEIRDHAGAKEGLRRAALEHFNLALENRNWRQAGEKLILARTAELAESEIRKNEALLHARESERASYLRKRAEELMNDAASDSRRTLHEIATYELISLKDPFTTDLLLSYVDHKNSDCRKLAMAVLAWSGDKRAVTRILPHINERTASGVPNPPDVQEAAICAICMLAADDDMVTYRLVHDRIWVAILNAQEALSQRVRVYYEPYSKRMAPKSGELLAAAGKQTALQWQDQGVKHFDAQQWNESIACFDKALELRPNFPAALVGRGLSRQGARQFEKSLADFDQAIKFEPERAGTYLCRSVSRAELGDMAGTIADCTKCIELDPINAQAYSNRSRARSETGDLAGAIEDATNAIKIQPKLSLAYVNRGKARADAGDFGAALLDFDRGIELNPRDDLAYCLRSYVHALRRQAREALFDANKALELNPSSAGAFACRAYAKYLSREFQESMADLNRAIDLDPNCAPAWKQRADLKLDQNNVEGAIADYNKAIELKPYGANLYDQRARARHAKEDFAGMIVDLSKSIELNSKNGYAYINRGLARERLGDLAGALVEFNKAMELGMKDAPLLVNRGAVLQRLNDPDGALRDFNQALALDPRSSDAYLNRGIIKINKRDFDGAIADYNKALELNPQHERASKLLKEAAVKKQSADKL